MALSYVPWPCPMFNGPNSKITQLLVGWYVVETSFPIGSYWPRFGSIQDPMLVFLDEVTSGLDSAAAAGVMQFLRDVARTKARETRGACHWEVRKY